MMIFRVHPDLTNRDLEAGELYDEDFNRILPSDLVTLGPDLLINPLTPDQFAILQTAHDAEVPITVEVTGLTDGERESLNLDAE